MMISELLHKAPRHRDRRSSDGPVRGFSIKRRMLFILMSVLIPAVIFLTIYNIYVVNAANDSLANVSTTTLSLYCQQIEQSIGRFNNNMINIVANDNNFRALSYKNDKPSDNKADSWLNAHLSALAVTDQYQQLMNTEASMAVGLLISVPNDFYRGVYRSDISGYFTKETITQYFTDKIDAGEKLGASTWQAVELDGSPYLYRCLGYNSTYCIYLLDPESFDIPANGDSGNHSMAAGTRLVFFNEHGPLTQKSLIEDNGIELKAGDGDGYYFSGKPSRYMVLTAPVSGTDVWAAYLVPYAGMLKNLNNSQYLLFIGSLMMLLLIPLGYFLLKKSFFKPVDRLVAEMESIQKNQETVMVPDEVYPELEFRKVNHTFNDMLAQIRDLKIEAYEQELNITRVSLQYYQIQIRPHFFLNCLKNIYGMAEEHNYANIQKSILYLSNHLRYMLRDDARIVTLEEELQYVRNYMLLQQLSAKYPPECEIDVSGDILGLKLPAISILSFVENSVKYFAGENESLKINIRLTMLSSEDGRLANITIHDNGRGFAPEQLEQYNYYDKYIGSNGGHIGVYNVIQRFLLYFGRERVGFAFSNQQGAQVDIFIKCDEAEDNDDESSDN